MSKKIETRISELGIKLPQTSSPLANYVPYIKSGNLVFLSGQVPIWNGEMKFVGKVGRELSIDQGVEAARICGLNIIAQLRDACDGDLDRVKQIVKLDGFVNGAEDFTNFSIILNGVSDLMVDVFGDIGKSVRTAVGAKLPAGLSVEVDGVFEIE